MLVPRPGVGGYHKECFVVLMLRWSFRGLCLQGNAVSFNNGVPQYRLSTRHAFLEEPLFGPVWPKYAYFTWGLPKNHGP